MADRSVSVSLRVRAEGAIAQVRTLQKSLKDFNQELTRSAEKREALRDLGNAAGTAGAAAAVGVGAMIKAAANFDKSMSAVRAATGETAANMDLLRAAAIKAGADTSFSATEAAAGIEELAKAGVATKDVLTGGLRGALDLAAAGSISVAEAAEVSASTMNQFGLAGRDVTHIADVLAATAGKAQGSVSDVGQAFKYVGPVAAQMGVSLEETAGAVGLLASRGILADQAGTSLRGMLSSLTSPSKIASDTMKQLGINVYDAQGQFVGFDGVAGQLQSKLQTLTNAERDQALGRLFGNEQITAARVLYEGGASAVEKWTKGVNDQSYATDQAATKLDNLAGDLERLKGGLETAFIGTGQNAQGPLRSLVKTGDDLINTYNKAPQPLKDTALALGGVTAAVGLATFAAVRGRLAFIAMNSTLTTLGLRSEKAAGQVSTLGKSLALRGGGAAAGAGLIAVTDQAEKSSGALGTLTKTAGYAAMGFSVAGPWGALIGGGVGLLSSLGGATKKVKVEMRGLSDEIDAQTLKLTDNGRAMVINKLQKEGTFKAGRKVGISADQTAAYALGDPKAITEVENALSRLVVKYQEARRANRPVDPAVISAIGEYRTLLGSAADAVDETENKSRQATKYQKILGDQMAITSDKGKALSAAMGKVPRDLIVKVATPGAVKSTKDVAKLARQYDLTPKQIRTLIKTAGLAKGKSDVDAFAAAVDKKLKSLGPYTVDVGLSAKAIAAGAMVRGAQQNPQLFGLAKAEGGEIPIWMGTRGKDSVPVMAMPGEHMLTTKEVEQMGGQSEVYRFRQMVRSGEFKKRGDVGFPGKGKSVQYRAAGGEITRAVDAGLNVDSFGLNAAAASVSAQFDAYAADISAELQRVVDQLVKLMTAGVGGLSPVQIARGQAFAKSQVGKPYVWGGVGPGGYDCSGFVSAVLNAALGMNPYSRRGATGSMPWAGFRNGGGGAFDVGWFTGNPGHTAARIGNMNVESYGGHGPAVGKGARGPEDGLFNRRMSYAGKRDVGGMFPDGSFVANTSGRPEWVLNPRQTQHLAAGGAVTKSENLSMPRTSGGTVGSLTWALQANTAAVSRNTTATLSPAAALTAANTRKSQFDATVTTLEGAQSRASDAQSNVASRLDILNQQKSVRDLQKSLASKKKGERLKGLDRQIAQVELGEAQKELGRMNASRAALDKARAALAVAQKNRNRYGTIAQEEARVAAAEAAVEAAQARSEAVASSADAVTDQAGIGDARSASAINRNLSRTIANIGQFTSVMSALRARGASPWLLAQLNEAGPTRAAIRIGQQYLQNAPALTELNQKTALLSSLGQTYGSLTNDPRFMGSGAAPALTTQQRELLIRVEALTASEQAAEIARQVKFQVGALQAEVYA